MRELEARKSKKKAQMKANVFAELEVGNVRGRKT